MTLKYMIDPISIRRSPSQTKMIIYMEIYISFVNFGC